MRSIMRLYDLPLVLGEQVGDQVLWLEASSSSSSGKLEPHVAGADLEVFEVWKGKF